MTNAPVYQKRLNAELSERLERRSGYSLRAFARTLGIDAAALSRILSGKKIPSYALSQKIFRALSLSPAEQREFLESVAKAQRQAGFKKIPRELRALSEGNEPRSRKNPRELSLEIFRTISDWYHYAILELTFVEGFQSDARWIAKRLGITVMEARLAIDRLLELELLERREGRLVKTDYVLKTGDRELTTSAHRKRQRQILEKSLEALETIPIERRNHSAITLAIDPELIPIARKRIHEFSHELSDLLGGGRQTKVYEMSVSLFPLEKEK